MDVARIIHEALAAPGSDLYSRVGDRVWEDPPNNWQNDRPAVEFDIDDETIHAAAAMAVVQVEFRCYGGSHKAADARAVYAAVRTRLRHAAGTATASGRVHYARPTGGRPGDREADTGWPVATLSYEMGISE